MIELNMVW